MVGWVHSGCACAQRVRLWMENVSVSNTVPVAVLSEGGGVLVTDVSDLAVLHHGGVGPQRVRLRAAGAPVDGHG